MFKKLLIISAMLVFVVVAGAAPVTREQAQRHAAEFVLQQQGASGALRVGAQTPTMQVVADLGYYYVFNVGQDNGFVIVSGDDRTMPVLGYSTEGHFDATCVPSNMQWMLDSYAEQLKELSTLTDADAASRLAAPRRTATVNTRNSIAPLVTSKWDQATPYWNKCPQFMISDNEEDGYELAYTGCVATAMAQIMNFYKQPAQTLAEIPSYSFTYGDGNYNYATQTMDALPVTTLDWEHMRDTYTGAEDQVYTDAVANLMLAAGCSVKMQYGTSASGAYTDDIPKGFTYFGYGSKIAFRIDHTQQTWDDLVYSELAAGRPMIYNGTAGSGGGHSFVCDGFEAGDYFHINWGWGGMGNGYFQLAIMNPSASGIGGSSSSEGYNMKQNIIYNIIPGTATPSGSSSGDDETEEPALTATNISGPSGWDRNTLSQPFKIHKSKIVKVSYSDHSGTGKKFKVALALYNPADGTYTVLPNSASNIYMAVTTSASGETTQFGKDIAQNASNIITFGAGLTGTYHLVGMYQVQGSSEWKPMKESDRYYLEVNMSDTYCQAATHPYIDLTVTGWEFTGGEKVGVKEQVHATIKNNSVDRYFGDLYLDFGGQQLDEYSAYTSVIQAEIPAGEEKTVTFNITPASAGTKTTRIMLVDSYGSFQNLSAAGSVTIAEGGGDFSTSDLSVVIKAENAATEAVAGESPVHGIIYDSHARFSAAITNHNTTEEYNKYILAPLFIVDQNHKGSMVTYQQLTISLQPGETKTYYFDFDNLAYGSTYAMNIYARNSVPMDEDASHVDNIVKRGESVYYDIQPGIVVWNAEGHRSGYEPVEGFAVPADAAAVSLENLSLSSLTPNANPNTIYILGENANVPSSLSGKNVVKGQKASEIVLEDGYPYPVPQSVVADKVTYRRTFTQSRTANERAAWSTMVLPFAATTVQIDGRTPVAGTDYWVYNFPREEDGVVTFDAVSQLEANVPYLVAVATDRDMTGKVMAWSAQNVTLKAEPIAYTSGKNYLLAGTYCPLSETDCYVMDAQGSQFVYSASAQSVAPFRARFKAMQTVSDNGVILCPGLSTTLRSITLAKLLQSGDTLNEYIITDLTAVDEVGGLLMCKDANGCVDDERDVMSADTWIDYMKMSGFGSADKYDQSHWVALSLPEKSVPSSLLNSQLSGVQGRLTDTTNPVIEVSELPKVIEKLNGQSKVNTYIPCSFAGTQESPVNGKTYFFVQPKPMELCYVDLAMWDATSQMFITVPRDGHTNTAGLSGVFAYDPSYVDTKSSDALVDKAIYQLSGVVHVVEGASQAPGRARVAGDASSYVFYPTLINVSERVITSIGDVSHAASVVNVTYVNPMGQVSSRPFDGLNIVVTRYSDGRSTTCKVVR